MKRLLLIVVLLAGVSAVWAQQRGETKRPQGPIKSGSDFESLVEAGAWAHLSGENGQWQLRLLSEREKQLVEERVRRWREAQEEYQRKLGELQPEINLLEDRLRILTGFAREAGRRIRLDDPRVKETTDERELTEQRLQKLKDELEVLRDLNQPPTFMGATWESADLAQVVDLGEDYIGLQRDDYMTYYRLSDVAVIQRAVPRRGLDEPKAN